MVMGKFVKATQKSSVAEGASICVELEGKRIALFQTGGKFYALEDSCKHRGGPLSEGSLDGNAIACPWHGFVFDVTTGNCATIPGMKQGTFPIKIEGDDIF